MAVFNGKIEKSDALLVKLANIDKNIVSEVKKAITKNGNQAMNKAKKKAPKDTGALRKSIIHRVERSPKKVRYIIYTNCKYALYQEMGTGVRGKFSPSPPKSNGGNDGIDYSRVAGNKATPFLYPALQEQKDILIKDIKEIVKQVVKEARRWLT